MYYSFLISLATGNFLIQLVCPYLCDDSASLSTSMTNLYTCTDNTLDGVTNVASSAMTPIHGANKIQNGTVNAAVLLFAKISVTSLGRLDAESGYLGASMNVTSTAIHAPDVSASNFSYVNKQINGAIASPREGLNVIYTRK